MIINRVFDEVFRTWSNVAVLRALMDTNTGFSGNEVARTAGMNPRSAFRALTLLEELGIVNRQIGGRDHIFTLNREHYVVNEVLNQLFQKEMEFRNEIIKYLKSILKKRVYSAVIFGSVARKEEKALSDLDICCVVNSQMDVLFVQETLEKKSRELYKKFGVKLAPVYFIKAHFMKKKKTKLINDIVEEGILIAGKHPKGLING
ncbi:MAG: hypothetical protein C4543_05610 [Ignavibacteriales bacterium]|nr:MAG: hypothetical protein C4543_05610 [Ignavibacteriales bacterium]